MPADTPATPDPSSLTEADVLKLAMARLDEVNRVKSRFNHWFTGIEKGESFQIPVAHLTDEGVAELSDALSQKCLMVWGRRPGLVTADGVLTVVPPHEPPVQPTFCGSCGAALAPAATSLRWHPPGRSASHGQSGWEHQCNPRVPQAGYFTAECDTPYAGDSIASGIYETARFVSWWEAAVRRVREGDAFRAADSGHLFAAESGTNIPPACRQCGLSARAFILIPDDKKWRCPGEPAPAAVTPLPLPAPAPAPDKDTPADADRTTGRTDPAPIGNEPGRGASEVLAAGGDAPGTPARDPQLRPDKP